MCDRPIPIPGPYRTVVGMVKGDKRGLILGRVRCPFRFIQFCVVDELRPHCLWYVAPVSQCIRSWLPRGKSPGLSEKEGERRSAKGNNVAISLHDLVVTRARKCFRKRPRESSPVYHGALYVPHAAAVICFAGRCGRCAPDESTEAAIPFERIDCVARMYSLQGM